VCAILSDRCRAAGKSVDIFCQVQQPVSEPTDRFRFARNCAVIAVLSLAGAFIAYLSYRQNNPARGYTALGITYGIVGTLLFAFAMAYSLRKRGGQERLPWTLEVWLSLHWVVAVFAIGVAMLHAGFNVNGRSGTWLLVVVCVSVASGIFGWFRYREIPKDVAATTGNLAINATDRELKAVRQKIADAEAGRTPAFRAHAVELRAGRRLGILSDVDEGEATALFELNELLHREGKLADRQSKQIMYRSRLRGWLWIHIPTSLLIIFLLPYHMIDALDVRYRLFSPAPPDFASPEACAQCHVRQYSEWIGSMHAIAQLSPVTDLQTRLVLAKEKREEDARVSHTVVGDLCERCHAPTGTFASPSEHQNPLKEVTSRASASMFGVSCVACHQIVSIKEATDNPDFPLRNANGLTWHAGRTYVGPFGSGTPGDPLSIGNSFHRGSFGPQFKDPLFCRSCHTVTIDDPSTGIVRLALQNTWAEWEDKKNKNVVKWSAGEGAHCAECHSGDLSGVVAQITRMQAQRLPLVDRRNAIRRILDDARVAVSPMLAAVAAEHFDQALPARTQFSHTFTGVDYHLEEDLPFPASNPHRSENASIQHEALCRVEQLLKLAAAIKIKEWPNGTHLQVDVMNLATGHNFPAGFAFARETWLEVATSPTRGGDDWTVIVGGSNRSPLQPNVELDTQDPGLRNFQAVLFDENANRPTVLQNETTGVLKLTKELRDHGFTDREQFLLAGEIRNITIPIPISIGTSGDVLRIRARLRFRNYPPDFLLGLAERFKAEGESAQANRAAALVNHLRIFEVSEDVKGLDFDPKPEGRTSEFGCVPR
jgi:hypothetical protein